MAAPDETQRAEEGEAGGGAAAAWAAWIAAGAHLAALPLRVINLDRDVQRWAHIERTLGATFPRLYRVPAVNGSVLNLETDPRVSLRAKQILQQGYRFSHKDIDSVGALGCSLSHLRAWVAALRSGAPLSVIAEDDCDPAVSLFSRISDQLPRERDAAMAALASHPATVWLLNMNTVEAEVTARIPRAGAWQSTTGFFGTMMYAANAKALQVLIAHALPVDVHVDAYMSMLAAMGKLRLVLHPALRTATQHPFASTIDHGQLLEGFDSRVAYMQPAGQRPPPLLPYPAGTAAAAHPPRCHSASSSSPASVTWWVWLLIVFLVACGSAASACITYHLTTRATRATKATRR